MARVAGQKVVVLGGGIAGLEAAIDSRKAGFSVTLVSNRKYIYLSNFNLDSGTQNRL